jgi:hypothetical protein
LDQVVNADVMTYLKTWFRSKSQGKYKDTAVSTLTNKLAQFECIAIISRKWRWNKDVIQSFLNSNGVIADNIQEKEESSWVEVDPNLSVRPSSLNEYDVMDAAVDCLCLLEQKYGLDKVDQ